MRNMKKCWYVEVQTLHLSQITTFVHKRFQFFPEWYEFEWRQKETTAQCVSEPEEKDAGNAEQKQNWIG